MNMFSDGMCFTYRCSQSGVFLHDLGTYSPKVGKRRVRGMLRKILGTFCLRIGENIFPYKSKKCSQTMNERVGVFGSVKCRWEKYGTNIGPFMAHKLPKIGP